MTGKFLGGLFCLGLLSTTAYAQCTGAPLTNAQLNQFGGKTVSFDCVTGCAGWMSSTAVDWHETHVNGGRLEEVGKEGTTQESLQPREEVGTWRVNNNPENVPDEICYTYTGGAGGPYCYQVYGTPPVASGSSYAFCFGTTHKATGTVD